MYVVVSTQRMFSDSSDQKTKSSRSHTVTQAMRVSVADGRRQYHTSLECLRSSRFWRAQAQAWPEKDPRTSVYSARWVSTINTRCLKFRFGLVSLSPGRPARGSSSYIAGEQGPSNEEENGRNWCWMREFCPFRCQPTHRLRLFCIFHRLL